MSMPTWKFLQNTQNFMLWLHRSPSCLLPTMLLHWLNRLPLIAIVLGGQVCLLRMHIRKQTGRMTRSYRLFHLPSLQVHHILWSPDIQWIPFISYFPALSSYHISPNQTLVALRGHPLKCLWHSVERLHWHRHQLKNLIADARWKSCHLLLCTQTRRIPVR